MTELETILSLGVTEQKANETLKNRQLTQTVCNVVGTALKLQGDNQSAGFEKAVGVLLFSLCSKLKPNISSHMPLIVGYIVDGRISTETQLQEAIGYLAKLSPGCQVDVGSFETAAGVGVVVSDEQIDEAVKLSVEKHRERIVEQRYRFNTGPLVGQVRGRHKFADVDKIKAFIQRELVGLIGPKTEEDLAAEKGNVAGKKVKVEKTKAPKTTPAKNEDDPAEIDVNEFLSSGDRSGSSGFIGIMGAALRFHKPGENYTTDGYVVTPKTMDLLKKHLEETNRRVITRFPPEPNGVLHIGHAKAINFNFGYARAHNGRCYLRYDDTNPEKEEERFFTAIREMVEWLGYKPYKITHASDNFDQLYELAVDLIRRGHAYVCHQRSDELKGHNPPASPWRDRPIEESLRLFEDMKRGKLAEGEATLRMKMQMEDGKVDPVAYRIKFCEHFRTDACIREVLNTSSRRAMAVLEPLRVNIVNFGQLAGQLKCCRRVDDDSRVILTVPDFPSDPSRGQHEVPFGAELFIERSDFREEPIKGYKRLAVGQPVGLQHAGVVLEVVDVVKSGEKIDSLRVKASLYDGDSPTKPSGFIHWVSDGLVCEVRLFEKLFLHSNPEDPEQVPGGFLSDINPNSEQVVSDALVDRSVAAAQILDSFQFERVGFFCVDSDSTLPERLVFNRTVPLREDKKKL